ncbi:hypothetical protein Pan216_27460 [Planctomycetes bacterium Pan216]|uniref:MotA/TolQ/ExbB proton channel domain-containing protein n=1 Tax=Kolteria novifilia TaxID=2527975 RepID=A0A518B4G5_9BACT|nr:hypothetical protein Pan216_27460 [Planctomycetes bacterium Pan216]
MLAWLEYLETLPLSWTTTGIHLYAAVVFLLAMTVWYAHRSRLTRLARRVASVADRVEGKTLRLGNVRLEQVRGLVLSLSDSLVRHRDRDIAAVLDFVRAEERHGDLAVARTTVNLVETMIELFPILGILGTVYAISGVGQGDFTSSSLLSLFGVATGTTLWALFYAVIFRIGYSAFIQGTVAKLEESNEGYDQFLAVLEERSREFPRQAAAAPSQESTGSVSTLSYSS